MQKKFCRGLLSLALTGIALLAYAQNPLKIGDALPKQFWETPLQMVNTPQKTTTLSADKDKLILLDFWATWCSGCLLSMHKMEDLQKEFGSKIKIVAVTKENKATIDKFFATKNGQKFNDLRSVIEDKRLNAMFPHYAIPYIVWIKDGKVINTTDAEQVSAKAVNEILQGDRSSLQTVIQIDRSRPLMLSANFDLEKMATLTGYSLLAKGRIRAIPYGSGFHRDGNLVYGRQYTNFSLMDIYRGIAYRLFEKNNERFNNKRLINLAKQPQLIDFDTSMESEENDSKWYSIEYLVPRSDADSLYPRMLRYINENTSYTASVEKRKVNCLVLKRLSSEDKIASKGGPSVDDFFGTPSKLHNVGLEYLIAAINDNNDLTDLLVLDETGYKGKVDLDFDKVNDFKSFQSKLEKYDLTLSEEERDIPMLIVKDKN